MREDWGKAQNWSDKKCNVEINVSDGLAVAGLNHLR